MGTKDHICICVCTYKRAKYLPELFERLEKQETENLFDYSIIIVDNDIEETAHETVSAVSNGANVRVNYLVEPQQNIALARNRAIKNAKGNLIAFIDDDEIPGDNWLLTLFKTYIRFRPSGVFGPIMPRFTEKPPEWIEKGKFFEQDIRKTGTILDWNEIFTGNALISKNIFENKEDFFDPNYGKTGGEDTTFFKKMLEKKYKFISCQEAIAYEIIPSYRMKARWLFRRSLRTGGVYGKIKVGGRSIVYRGLFVIKSAIASFIFLGCVLISLFIGKHVAVKNVMRMLSNIGKITGAFNCIPEGYTAKNSLII